MRYSMRRYLKDLELYGTTKSVKKDLKLLGPQRTTAPHQVRRVVMNLIKSADYNPSSSPSSREDEMITEESQSSNNTSQGIENTVGEFQQDTNRSPQKMTPAEEKHDDDNDLSDGKTGPGSENTDGVVHQETGGGPPDKHKERTTEKHDDDDDDGQEPHSASGSSAVDKLKRIATSRPDDGDDEDSGDSERDEKERNWRVKRQKKTVNKGKQQFQQRQPFDDDWDGGDRQTTATRSPQKGQKKTAVTREHSDVDAPEMEVKKKGKRRWNYQERTAVKRHLAKFIALKKVPTRQDCLMCIDKEFPVLRARTWKDVKYFVFNEIVKIKRKRNNRERKLR